MDLYIFQFHGKWKLQCFVWFYFICDLIAFTTFSGERERCYFSIVVGVSDSTHWSLPHIHALVECPPLEHGLDFTDLLLIKEHCKTDGLSLPRLCYKISWLSLELSLSLSTWSFTFGKPRSALLWSSTMRVPHEWAWKLIFWVLPIAMRVSLEADLSPFKP